MRVLKLTKEEQKMLKSLASTIARERVKKGLSASETAKKASLTPPQISALEKAKTPPSLFVLLRTVRALKMKPAKLFSENSIS